MAKLTNEQVAAMVWKEADSSEYDNQGQLVIYTGIYFWHSDKSFHDEPEPQETEEAFLNRMECQADKA